MSAGQPWIDAAPAAREHVSNSTPLRAVRASRPTRRGAGFSAAVACALLLFTSTALAATEDDVAHKYRALSPGLHWSGNTMTWYYAPDGQPAWANTQDMV